MEDHSLVLHFVGGNGHCFPLGACAFNTINDHSLCSAKKRWEGYANETRLG